MIRTGTFACAAVVLASCGSDSSPAISSGDPKKDAIALYEQVTLAAASCDAAAAVVPLALTNGDMVAAFRAAENAEAQCLTVGSAIRKIGIPESLGSANRAAAEKAIEACDTLYVNKWSGARSLKAVIDGDTSPSAIAEIQDQAEAIEAGNLLCSGGLVSVAMAEGATLAELGIDTDKPKK